MLNLPPHFILFDSEYTAWEGSQARKWSGENEHKEIVQIGAIRVSNDNLFEEESFLCFIKPKVNTELSDYFIELTGITQSIIEKDGVDFSLAIVEFKNWCGETPVYSFGRDGEVVVGNCNLLNIPCPFSPKQFHNIRDFFALNGIPTEGYYSSTIVEAFGEKPMRKSHDALNDVRTTLDGLHLLNSRISS